MNNDILIEKIKYLSSLPHSALVEHCIYLENENDNYKAQKYITDFISENGIICEKNKEIERLNNIINEILEMVCCIEHNLDKYEEIGLDHLDYARNKVDELKEYIIEELKEGK